MTRAQLKNSTASATRGLVRLLVQLRTPPSLKWVVCVLFAINIKSWPTFWHFRVFRPVIRSWVLNEFVLWLRLRLAFSKARREAIMDDWFDKTPLVGLSPFEYRNVYRTRATLDECDYNMHLSNSSYAKVLDASRFECLVELFPVFFKCGGAMAMGATNFHFIREIPPLKDFEIRSSIGAWDNKWLYLVSKFVSKPPKSKGSRATSGTTSPTNGKDTPPTRSVQLVEPDGSIVYCTAVVQLCFKAGRITIPPAIVLATNGFCNPTSTSSSSPSSTARTPPPPHWEQHVKLLVSPRLGGSAAKYFEFLKSGWKEVKEKSEKAGEEGISEVWWEVALGGPVEERRIAGLEELGKLRQAMEAARVM